MNRATLLSRLLRLIGPGSFPSDGRHRQTRTITSHICYRCLGRGVLCLMETVYRARAGEGLESITVCDDCIDSIGVCYSLFVERDVYSNRTTTGCRTSGRRNKDQIRPNDRRIEKPD